MGGSGIDDRETALKGNEVTAEEKDPIIGGEIKDKPIKIAPIIAPVVKDTKADEPVEDVYDQEMMEIQELFGEERVKVIRINRIPMETEKVEAVPEEEVFEKDVEKPADKKDFVDVTPPVVGVDQRGEEEEEKDEFDEYVERELLGDEEKDEFDEYIESKLLADNIGFEEVEETVEETQGGEELNEEGEPGEEDEAGDDKDYEVDQNDQEPSVWEEENNNDDRETVLKEKVKTAYNLVFEAENLDINTGDINELIASAREEISVGDFDKGEDLITKALKRLETDLANK